MFVLDDGSNPAWASERRRAAAVAMMRMNLHGDAMLGYLCKQGDSVNDAHSEGPDTRLQR